MNLDLARFLQLLKMRRGGIMNEKRLIERIAKLESINDQLAAELQYLEKLTRALGFAEGLKTLKEAAQEMLEQDQKKIRPEDEVGS